MAMSQTGGRVSTDSHHAFIIHITAHSNVAVASFHWSPDRPGVGVSLSRDLPHGELDFGDFFLMNGQSGLNSRIRNQ